MKEFFSVAKELAPFLPLVQPLYDTLLKPKMSKLAEWVKKKDLDGQVFEHHLFEEKFVEYLCRSTQRFSSMDTLIFPNQQLSIETLYQPLTLSSNSFSARETFKVHCFPEKLFSTYGKVVISDTAGMGKSTLSKFIALSAIKEKKQIPIFIELRKLSQENGVINEILNQINSIDQEFSADFIFRLLTLGEFLIIFDGYDEIGSNDRQKIVQDLKLFIQKCNNCKFLLTTRPEEAIAAFGDFQLATIQGLKDSEAFQLLRKYDEVSRSGLSETLIKEIRQSNHQVKEFLINPFLVSLLYKSYSFKRDIPSRKSTFYNEVYTALYQDHDLSKDAYKRDKHSKLDIQDFRLVLREFAISTARMGEVGYSEEKAVEYLRECKKNVSFLTFKESLFIKDLLTTVPLFIKEGRNIRWSHKSIQDYFAAEYIIYHPKKDNILNQIVRNNLTKYQNIIDLVMELDPNLVRRYVLPDLLKKLIEHFESQSYDGKIAKASQTLRKMITFDVRFWINKAKLDEINFFGDEGYQDEFDRVQDYLKENFGEPYETATQFPEKLFVCSSRSDEALFLQMAGKKGLLGEADVYTGNIVRKYPKLENLTYDPTLVDYQNLDKEYNQPEQFDEVNNAFLYSLGREYRDPFFVPDIAYCKKLLKKINQELEEIEGESYLEKY